MQARCAHLVVDFQQSAYEVYVGRRVPTSPRPTTDSTDLWREGCSGAFGNTAGHVRRAAPAAARMAAVIKFLIAITQNLPLLRSIRNRLRGRRLGCWCSPRLCHGHVVAALANADQAQCMRWMKLVNDAITALEAAGDTAWRPDTWPSWDGPPVSLSDEEGEPELCRDCDDEGDGERGR